MESFTTSPQWREQFNCALIPNAPIVLKNGAAPKRKVHRSHQEQERHRIIPPHRLTQVKICEHHEHRQRDALLYDLQLICCKAPVANSISRNLETILAQRN